MGSDGPSSNITENQLDMFCSQRVVGPLIWAIFSAPCSLLGTVASVWLLWLIIRKQPSSGLKNDTYLIHLTAMDLIYNMFIIPTILNFFIWKDLLYLKLCDFLHSLNMSGRPLFMACICMDCYIAVIYPIHYLKLKHSNYRLLTCLLVWLFTLSYGTTFVIDREMFATPFTIVPYVFAIPTIIFCNVCILNTLQKPSPVGRGDVSPQKQRALQTIINSFAMTVFAYCPPLLVFGFLYLLPINTQDFYCNVATPTLMSSTLGSTLLPLLYVANLTGFQCRKM